MATRKVTLKVECDLPREITVREFQDYVNDAVGTWGGSYAPDDPFFDHNLRDQIKVKQMRGG